MMEKMENTRHFFELLWRMTEKELRVRYKNTFFGFLWIFINPILQMLVIGFIFRLFIKVPIANYFLYLLVGLTTWNFFALSLTKATTSIVYERSLIKKAKFPRSVIPLSIILSNFINLFLSFLIFFIPVFWLGTFSDFWFLQLLLGFSMLLLTTIGFSLLTSALNVKYRDINFFVQAIIVLWFYATPIVYSIFVIPKNFIWLWRINPLTSVVQLFQSAMAQAPSAGLLMIFANLIITLAILILGITIFLKESKNFDDWV